LTPVSDKTRGETRNHHEISLTEISADLVDFPEYEENYKRPAKMLGQLITRRSFMAFVPIGECG
jgi:hypothetical protein